MPKTFVVAHTDSPLSEWQQIQICPTLAEAQAAMDANQDAYPMVGIFYNRENWADYRPRYLIDNREHKFIHGLEGLINSLDSSWF